MSSVCIDSVHVEDIEIDASFLSINVTVDNFNISENGEEFNLAGYISVIGKQVKFSVNGRFTN